MLGFIEAKCSAGNRQPEHNLVPLYCSLHETEAFGLLAIERLYLGELGELQGLDIIIIIVIYFKVDSSKRIECSICKYS